MSVSRKLIKEVGRGMVGIPYIPGGLSITGCDCWGMMQIFYNYININFSMNDLHNCFHLEASYTPGCVIALMKNRVVWHVLVGVDDEFALNTEPESGTHLFRRNIIKDGLIYVPNSLSVLSD